MDHVARARAAIGKGIAYKLGQGGRDPARDLPATEGACDCSGFVAWVLGTSRRQADTIGWIETTRMWKDARGANLLFEELEAPEVGCVVVYPDIGKKQGHCGIVSQVEPLRVIDCSSGNYRRTGDAIQERDGTFFLKKGTLFARYLR
jgi:hypothetical protein